METERPISSGEVHTHTRYSGDTIITNPRGGDMTKVEVRAGRTRIVRYRHTVEWRPKSPVDSAAATRPETP